MDYNEVYKSTRLKKHRLSVTYVVKNHFFFYSHVGDVKKK